MIGKRINSKLLIFSLISILLIVLGLIYWFFKPEAGLAQSRNSDSQSQNVTENYALAMSDSKNTTLPTFVPAAAMHKARLFRLLKYELATATAGM